MRQDRSRLWRSLLWLLVALVPGSAAGQEPAPPGSLTVLSRPPGAAFEIAGDRVVLGRTPLTYERGLAGRFQVRSVEPGFERWEREVTLSGITQDTLWATLTAKSPGKAVVRSLAVPGWGQFYSERRTAGWVYLVGGVAAAGGALVAHLVYENRVDQIPNYTTVESRRWAIARAEQAYDARHVLLVATAGVWAVNLLDAALVFPKFGENRTPVGLDVSGRGAEGGALALRVRF